jgi:mono/diheme cytochrome c family protein
MKRFVSLTVILGLMAFAAAALSGPAAAQKKGGAKSSAAGLYQQHCAKCHGADGKGIEGLEPPDLTKNGGSDKSYHDAIANGRGIMPGYKDTLSAAQIQALVRHVRAFSKPAARSKKKA